MAEIFKKIACYESEDSYSLEQTPMKPLENPPEERSLPLEGMNPDELAALKENAFQDAYEKGFAQGLIEGREEGEKQHQENILNMDEQWQNVIKAIPLAVEQNRLFLKQDIADIVLAIIQQFFAHQQQHQEEIVLQINHILRQLNQEQIIEIALHPQDLAFLQQNRIKLDLNTSKNIRIIGDEQLRLGGCQIKSEHGFFDASIEKQIDRLKAWLLQIKQGETHVPLG